MLIVRIMIKMGIANMYIVLISLQILLKFGGLNPHKNLHFRAAGNRGLEMACNLPLVLPRSQLRTELDGSAQYLL